jgi:glycopeptide antibiotics resistance protein
MLLHLTAVYWFAQRSMSGPWVASGSMVPLHTVRAYLALGPGGAAEHVGGELLLLAPLGVLLPLAGGRVDASPLASFARTAFGGLMLAFGAEVVRDGVAGQVFDLDVVLLNAFGVVLAHLAVVPAARAALLRHGIGRLSRRGLLERTAAEPAAPLAPVELVP